MARVSAAGAVDDGDGTAVGVGEGMAAVGPALGEGLD
jgi:hypothetical protein